MLQTINPNGNSVVQLSPNVGTNWECVSTLHQTEPDDAVTYVENQQSGNTSQTDYYTIEANTIGLLDTINSVKFYFRGKKVQFVAGSSCQGTVYVKTHGLAYPIGSLQNFTISWVTYNRVSTLNPNTLAAWTKTEIDALIAGILVANTDGDKAIGDVTWYYIVVDYTPSAGNMLRRLLVSVGL